LASHGAAISIIVAMYFTAKRLETPMDFRSSNTSSQWRHFCTIREFFSEIIDMKRSPLWNKIH
jgi:hypothetical protein